MTLSSPAFQQGQTIPTQYTCDGDNINPPLVFSDIPTKAKSLALIMFDPDVPKSIRQDGNWNHWLVWNIPPTTTKIPSGANPGTTGKNTSGHNQYDGPCPPDRQHRYFFRLYALDVMLNLPVGSNRTELELAIQNHILAQAELMGRYKR